ncbi:AraC family transcriptional regulator [Tolumonas lignilytica]|uniref:AraC-like transcriptional regulator QhpR n=1 Tax=Tolumonas lignilytica TaxID=1283284 RepID=UPI0004ADA995|nr:AraC family transcriptional regulator [Tolumonas lignilytica]
MIISARQSALTGMISDAFDSNRGVLAAAATGLSDFISSNGGDVDRIFGVSGIDPELLANPTLSLDLVNYCRVMEEAARYSGVDNFGLYYGKQFKPQSLGLIGYIGLSSPTLTDALHNMATDFQWHQHHTLTQMVDIGDCWRLDYQVRHGAILCRRQDAELTLGMFLNVIRYALGKNWAPRAVHFEHPRPEQWHEHSKVFDAPVWFEQPYNSLIIPKADLVRCSMPESDTALLMVLRQTIRQLNRMSDNQDLIDQTRTQVRLQMMHGEPNLDEVAAKMGLSPWSLQRNLKREGISFSTLVDKLRCEMATRYMQQNQLSISDMALLLGYSEVSAFSRAFRRWFNISPRQWRNS